MMHKPSLTPSTARRVAVSAAVSTAVLVVSAFAVRGQVAPPPTTPPSAAVEAAIEPGISRPVEESKLTFAAPGLVAEVMVKEGDVVKQGQVLSRQDDRGEKVALQSDQLEAESTAEIEYEKADVAEKQIQYKRKQELYDMEGHNISLSEVEDAKMAVELAKAQVKVAELHHGQKGLDRDKQQLKVDLMQLRSPIDGVVQKINAHAGEMADPQSKDGAIVVVKNDPIWVEIHPSSDRAQKLQMGQELQVRYTAPFGEPANPWMAAKIIYFAPQADASSKTELVRLELSNAVGMRSGLAMEVRLPANASAVAAGGPMVPASPGSNGPALPPAAN